MYYDIHTHHTPAHHQDIAILNLVVKSTDAGNSTFSEKKSSNIFYSCGIHPWYIDDIGQQINLLHQYMNHPSVIAIGEAGLDKLAEAPMEQQKNVFTSQCLLAEEKGKPLIIHCVKAWDELIAVRKVVSPHVPWIIHGFRGNGELARQLIRQGFYLSFGELYNSTAIEAAWPDHMLVETDDREADIRKVYVQLAETLKIAEDSFASRIAENVRQVFSFD